MTKNNKGAKNLGNLRIYDNIKQHSHTRESRGVSSGFIKFKPMSGMVGRFLELQLNGRNYNAIRVRKVWAEVIEVLKANGYSVGRRERDV